jgi:hypothetical protein
MTMYPKPEKKQKPKKEQKDMFLQIWEEREHISELSGEYLGEEPNVWYFAHILGKGAYPQAKHDKENIMLVTQKEHWELDQNTHKAKANSLYKPFFDKQQELKERYS